jgi:hypothetical protein
MSDVGKADGGKAAVEIDGYCVVAFGGGVCETYEALEHAERFLGILCGPPAPLVGTKHAEGSSDTVIPDAMRWRKFRYIHEWSEMLKDAALAAGGIADYGLRVPVFMAVTHKLGASCELFIRAPGVYNIITIPLHNLSFWSNYAPSPTLSSIPFPTNSQAISPQMPSIRTLCIVPTPCPGGMGHESSPPDIPNHDCHGCVRTHSNHDCNGCVRTQAISYVTYARQWLLNSVRRTWGARTIGDMRDDLHAQIETTTQIPRVLVTLTMEYLIIRRDYVFERMASASQVPSI